MEIRYFNINLLFILIINQSNQPIFRQFISGRIILNTVKYPKLFPVPLWAFSPTSLILWDEGGVGTIYVKVLSRVVCKGDGRNIVS